MMVEVIGAKYGFAWVYDPPQDGEWGAVQESGNMSGLIGQAGEEGEYREYFTTLSVFKHMVLLTG